LGETISLAQSKLVLSAILLARGSAAEAEKAAQEAASAFGAAHAPGLEAEAALVCAAAQLGRSASRARVSLDRARELLRNSRDAQLTIRRDILTARLRLTEGRRSDSLAMLESALEQAHRIGLAGAEREARATIAKAKTQE
jgi:hypothetical protein